MWQGWQRVRRGEVGTLGLVRIGVSDLLGLSPGGGGGVYIVVPTLTPLLRHQHPGLIISCIF